VLIQVVDQAVSGLAEADTESERHVLAQLLRVVCELSAAGDGVLLMIATRVASRATQLAGYDVLYEAGCRAIRAEVASDLGFIQQAFNRLTRGTEEPARYANESAGRLVLYCATVAPTLSRAAWTRWWDAAQQTPEQDRVQIAIRIGAACLPVGNLSLAVEIALQLRGQDLDALSERIQSREGAAFENLLSELYGRLLGTDAETRIRTFLTFAQDIQAAVTTPG
jgi:hypothetical protein